MTDVSDNIFREYDIRGVWGGDLTADVARLIGEAYAVYVVRRGAPFRGERFRAAVGRDVRTSSRPIRDALIEGLTSRGIDCVDVGEVPTPLQYFAMHTLDVDGGLMITGSHNPPEYNGFKVGVGTETIHGRGIQDLKRVLKEGLGGPAPSCEPGIVEIVEIIPSYIKYVSERITLPALDKPVKVVLDSGNGTGGMVAPELIRGLGCEVVELFTEPDGRFPNHHPDPTIEANLADLKAAVAREGADFGVAFDGDADRIGVVDERGEVVWGDRLMVIFARAILEARPGATVVGDVKCSQVMYDEIKRSGGTAVMWKTGHSLIKSRMKELKAALAGEMSGHIFFADRWFGFDDAVYSACRLVEIMARKRASESGFAFSSLLSGLPRTYVTPEIRTECPDAEKFEVVRALEEAVGEGDEGFRINDIIKIDGLRINFDGGWALVRASNTQPVLVLRFEAVSPELLEEAKAFVRGRLAQVRPGAKPGF